MITIINTNASNIKSLVNALSFIEKSFKLSNEFKDLEKATHIIMPGVGSYFNLIEDLKKNFDLEDLKFLIEKNEIFFLGICVGMQILSSLGYEPEEIKGLDLIEGSVKRIDTNLNLPHVGWNSVFFNRTNKLLNNIPSGTDFYFTHSYEFNLMNDQNNLGETYYDKKIVSMVNNKNIYGVQFHPEKSQNAGLKLLKNFSEL
jgi:imidazole glycerol-phosphate synthase subunit HisH